jgi:hypothetical protein
MPIHILAGCLIYMYSLQEVHTMQNVSWTHSLILIKRGDTQLATVRWILILVCISLHASVQRN